MGFLLPQIRTWAEWGQLFTDVELWTPVVREICLLESICFRQIKAGYPGTNAVFCLGRDRTGPDGDACGRFVVKIYAPFCRGHYPDDPEAPGLSDGRVCSSAAAPAMGLSAPRLEPVTLKQVGELHSSVEICVRV